MKITIGYLFHDLLNLYGESGNVLALRQALETQDGIEVEVKNLSLDNEWDLENIDFIYIGTGTRNNQLIALEYLKTYKEEIKKYIECNKFFLATGNSIELFGKYILDKEEKNEMLGLFDYWTLRTENRRVSECVFEFEKVKSKILGFENNEGKTVDSKNPMFKVQKGYGTEKDEGTEGFMDKNFYGTYLIGPLLARNPELLELLCRDLILTKDNDFKFKDFDLKIEKEAHKKYLKRYDSI